MPASCAHFEIKHCQNFQLDKKCLSKFFFGPGDVLRCDAPEPNRIFIELTMVWHWQVQMSMSSKNILTFPSFNDMIKESNYTAPS